MMCAALSVSGCLGMYHGTYNVTCLINKVVGGVDQSVCSLFTVFRCQPESRLHETELFTHAACQRLAMNNNLLL